MNKIITKEFEIVNNLLGWGDLTTGLLFIGVEEGYPWQCDTSIAIIETKKKIQEIADKSQSHITYENSEERGSVNWPIAVVTSKIASRVSSSESNWRKYREELLWLNGSQVFNGNLLPLGKPNLKQNTWPAGYKELFGYASTDYDLYIKKVESDRYKAFQNVVRKNSPQAIICFGKSHWKEFEKVFVSKNSQVSECLDEKTKVFKNEKVIFTRHFSNGMPDATVTLIVEQLKKWKVSIK